ncbi:origin recognition complex subunit 5 C-terminus-domain-containing protein [Dipodascopsis tothii]|uniref:origin recognition complex subunit 5 C-terminus-domain-containing protein n=1 Tax=Dipodascopsis tothii TaxID=44089 RepID=UPI0034CE598A
MGAVSESELQALQSEHPGRYYQYKLLNTLLSHDYEANPSVLALRGQRSTGKTTVLRSFLDRAGLSYSWVACDKCITSKVVLQRALGLVKARLAPAEADADGADGRIDFTSYVDDFSMFVNHLNRLFRDLGRVEGEHVVVLDRLDSLSDGLARLFPCLVKLDEMLTHRNLTFVLVCTTAEPAFALTSAFPHVLFPPFTREDCLRILEGSAGAVAATGDALVAQAVAAGASAAAAGARLRALWSSYCQALISTYFALYGPDVLELKALSRRGFPLYVKPLLNGVLDLMAANSLIRLLRINHSLLASEELLKPSGIAKVSKAATLTATEHQDLPLYSKYLLCAAYLASFNKPQYDLRLFSKIREIRTRNRGSKKHTFQQTINRRYLAPKPFERERLMAIFHSIFPRRVVQTLDIQTQIATLETLRLLLRSSPGSGNADDILDARTNWRVNVSWDVIYLVSREIKLPIEHYLID